MINYLWLNSLFEYIIEVSSPKYEKWLLVIDCLWLYSD